MVLRRRPKRLSLQRTPSPEPAPTSSLRSPLRRPLLRRRALVIGQSARGSNAAAGAMRRKLFPIPSKRSGPAELQQVKVEVIEEVIDAVGANADEQDRVAAASQSLHGTKQHVSKEPAVASQDRRRIARCGIGWTLETLNQGVFPVMLCPPWFLIINADQTASEPWHTAWCD